MQTFEEYRITREKSAELLLAISEQLTLLGGEAKAKSLQSAAKRLLSNDFRIIFCGEFKRGKSTLINALLGKKSLPMKVAPCTGVITEVKYASKAEVLVYPLEGEPFQAPIEDLKKHIAIQNNETPDISRVELFFPLELCKNAITLIDSPGLNEDWRRTQISLQELSKADAVVMVLSCEMALSRSEMDFIQSRLLDRKLGTFFVWNRYDAIWNDNEEIAALRERSQSRLSKYNAQTYYLSAREALVAQLKSDEQRLLRSGLPSFMDSLEKFLTEKRASVKLVEPLQLGLKAAQYGANILSLRALALLNAPLEDLRKREARLRPRLDELERQRKLLSEAIEESIEDILNDLIECLDDFLGSMATQAYNDSADILFPSDANRQERQDFLVRWYRQWLREALQKLAKEQMEPKLRQGFEELKEDLQTQRKIFHANLQDILDLDEGLDLSSAPLFDTEWIKELPLFISTALALLILGASSSAIAISLLGLGALRAWLAGQTVNELERRKFAEALAKTLKSKRAEIIKLLREHLETSCREMHQEIDQEMDQLIKDTNLQLQSAISSREEGENKAEQEREKILSCQHALKQHFLQLSEIAQDE
ncbi:MAG: dynamin family protein [Myxococcota bacterium]|nr:dynamin family protein [Myxococcota bacterium]